MSSGDGLTAIIDGVVKARMIGADPDDADLTWELAFHIEGAVFDEVLRRLPSGDGRDLVEEVLALVDWERQAEKSTWRIEEVEV